MDYTHKPQIKESVQTNEQTIEEYKTIIEERRFVMSRYMQAIALYLALVAFSFKELLSANSGLMTILLLVFVTMANVLAFYGAGKFRSMAAFILKREALLADHFGMQRPHSIMWGYTLGVFVFLLTQLTIVAIILAKLFGPGA